MGLVVNTNTLRKVPSGSTHSSKKENDVSDPFLQPSVYKKDHHSSIIAVLWIHLM